MPFITSNSFEEKIAQKCFKRLKKLDRIKVPRPEASDVLCLLCDDSLLLLQNVVFCTSRSVYYLGGTGISLNRYDFPSISAVTLETEAGFSYVCLTISNGGAAKLRIVTKDAEKMVDYISSRIADTSSKPAFSVADEIMKYKKLLDCEAITAEEYEAKKKQLLG